MPDRRQAHGQQITSGSSQLKRTGGSPLVLYFQNISKKSLLSLYQLYADRNAGQTASPWTANNFWVLSVEEDRWIAAGPLFSKYFKKIPALSLSALCRSECRTDGKPMDSK